MLILQGVGTGSGVGRFCRGDDDQNEEGDERQHVADELNTRILQDLYHLKQNNRTMVDNIDTLGLVA